MSRLIWFFVFSLSFYSKYVVISSLTTLGSTHHTPWIFIPLIKLFAFHQFVDKWKNLVFKLPYFNHLTLNLCFSNASCLRFILLRLEKTSSLSFLYSTFIGPSSSILSISLIFANNCLFSSFMSPKISLFHTFKSYFSL